MCLVKAKDVKRDDVISNSEVLEKIGTYGRVIGILESGIKGFFRLIPYNKDSFLTIRLDMEKEENLVKHF